MPGVIMDNANMDGSSRRPGLHQATNGALSPMDGNEKLGSRATPNGSSHVNGTSRDSEKSDQRTKALQRAPTPFEIPHITQGFFPFGTLVHRAVQNCWNELTELISDLATIQVPADNNTNAPGGSGKSSGNQTAQNMHKKLKILEWGHARRAEFIKLLVLSEWSRHAAEVSRLIDIQGFIRIRHQAYMTAMNSVGMMKQDLVRAQVANPDLKTALEVLAKGKVASLPDVSVLHNVLHLQASRYFKVANILTLFSVWLQAPQAIVSANCPEEVAQDQPNYQRKTHTPRPSATCLAKLSGS